MRDFFKNAEPGNVWPDDLPLIPQEPDHGAVFHNYTAPQPVFGESFFEPKHEAPRRRRRLTAGVPWALAAAALVVAYVSATNPFGAAPMTYPSPSVQPAPKPAPAVTRTVRVVPPAVTVQAAPRPAETVYRTSTVVVTRTAQPKPAATVTVTATTTVPAEPEPAPAVPGG